MMGALGRTSADALAWWVRPRRDGRSHGPQRRARAADTRTTSLAEVLSGDGNRLDSTWQDFDAVEKTVYAVLDAKPDSPVAVLADRTTLG